MRNVILISLVMMLTACAGGSLRPDVTSRGEAREACPFSTGTLVAIEKILIEDNIEAAQAGGAAVGGYIGNRAMNDKGDLEEAFGTLAGAALGNVVGDAVGKGMRIDGINLFVSIDSSTNVSIVQAESDHVFKVGDQVLVTGYLKNRSRYTRNDCTLRVLPRR